MWRTDEYSLSRDITGCNLPKDGDAWLCDAPALANSSTTSCPHVIDEIKENGFCMLALTEGRT